MHDAAPAGSWILALAALSIPLIHALAATFVSGRDPFRRAMFASAAGLALTIFVTVAGLALSGGAPLAATLVPGVSVLGVRLDAATSVVLGLVSFIGLVILRFSRGYLDGDPGRPRFVRGLMATLAAVTLLVVSRHLLIMALAWVATSIALHQLLTFYGDRPQALIAAHKKFLVSRVADLCLFGAIALLGVEVGSLDLDDLAAWAGAVERLPTTVEVAAVLLVLGASIKCAQLPFHGWLIQVMEAPTPVSALLHAGVINLGGFLMIRLAPVLVRAELAQTLLVLIGSLTAVIAALVMTTRVSIKVMLAWSTCAQMGFMLVQCGLGAYGLALLHLLAHSLYKAHAFLSSGSTVDQWRAFALAPSRPRASFAAWILAGLVSLLGVAAVGVALGSGPSEAPGTWAFLFILGLALAPLFLPGAHRGLRPRALAALAAASVAALELTGHALASRALDLPLHEVSVGPRLAIVGASFTGLFLLQGFLQAAPEGHLARALYPRLFAGLHLDEVFTRVTFQLWPPKLPRRAPRPGQTVPFMETNEA